MKATKTSKGSETKQKQNKVKIIKQPEPPVTSSGEQEHPMQVNEMIREVAYLRAEQRGFVGGDPLEDWLVAEAQIKNQSK